MSTLGTNNFRGSMLHGDNEQDSDEDLFAYLDGFEVKELEALENLRIKNNYS